MSCCCSNTPAFDGVSVGYRRALVAVIAINAAMFAVELGAGSLAGSMALTADSLEFLADSLTYGLSLWVIGRPAAWRARTALLKGGSLAVMGAWVLGATLWQVLGPGVPEAAVMGGVGALALAANLASVAILFRWRDGDANVRSVWLCSRNDAIGNVAVLGAGAAVWLTASGWPDLIVAAAMAALFLKSAVSILSQALGELRVSRSDAVAAPGE